MGDTHARIDRRSILKTGLAAGASLTSICGGAVSGAWWKGQHRGSQEGFGIVGLDIDGTHARHHETCGWKAPA